MCPSWYPCIYPYSTIVLLPETTGNNWYFTRVVLGQKPTFQAKVGLGLTSEVHDFLAFMRRGLRSLIYQFQKYSAPLSVIQLFMFQTSNRSRFRMHYTASKIRDAYVFIAQNYSNGDEIFIFG